MNIFDFDKPNKLMQSMAFGLIALLFLGFLPLSPPSANAQQNCRTMNNVEVCDSFLDAWNKLGSEQLSLYVNGLPITPRRAELSLTDGKAYDTQWFERARFESHPENQSPSDVLLGLLGTSLIEGRNPSDPADKAFAGITQPPDADGQNKMWFPDTDHAISGKILKYWSKYGGLQQFGYPLSEPFDEVSPADGKTYTVQYFQRNRFELHPENQPPYEVELGLLGVEQYKLQAVPNEQLPNSPPNGVQSARDTLTLAMTTEPEKLSSIGITPSAGGDYNNSTSLSNALMITGAIEDKLVEQDDSGNFYPEDAYYIPTLENGGSYFVGNGPDRHLVTKFNLRRGMHWSDGTELTAVDAKHAYDIIQEMLRTSNNGNFDLRLWQRVASVVPVGRYTVIYNWMSYNQAVAKYNDPSTDKMRYEFLSYFISNQRPVLHPNYFLVGDIRPHQQTSQEVRTTRNPLGTGPFQVESWNDHVLSLVRNPNYSLTSKPLLNRIVFKFFTVPGDISKDLQSSAVDGAVSGAFASLPLDPRSLGPNQQIAYNQTRAWEHLDFDFNFGPFQDLAARQAIIKGINRTQIVSDATFGGSVVLNTVIPPANWTSLQNETFASKWRSQYTLPTYSYDPAQAAQQLANAGWVKGEDGVLVKNGQRLSFHLALARTVPRMKIAEQVKSDLHTLGIEVEIDYLAANAIPNFGSSVPFIEFAHGPGDDPNFSFWRTANSQSYSNSQVDALIDQLENETSREKIEQLSAQIQIQLMNDVAVVPLYPRVEVEVYPADLRNWKLSYEPARRFTNVTQWYFK